MARPSHLRRRGGQKQELTKVQSEESNTHTKIRKSHILQTSPYIVYNHHHPTSKKKKKKNVGGFGVFEYKLPILFALPCNKCFFVPNSDILVRLHCVFLGTWTCIWQRDDNHVTSDWGSSRQEYWSGFPFPSPGNLPDQGIKLSSPSLVGWFFTIVNAMKPIDSWEVAKNIYKEDWYTFLPASFNANVLLNYNTILKTKNWHS